MMLHDPLICSATPRPIAVKASSSQVVVSLSGNHYLSDGVEWAGIECSGLFHFPHICAALGARDTSSSLDAVPELSTAALDVIDTRGEGQVSGNGEAQTTRLDDGALASHHLRLQQLPNPNSTRKQTAHV